MTKKTYKRLEKRRHKLIVRYALGKITPLEKLKLDRLQNLLRPEPTEQELKYRSAHDYKCRMLSKELGKWAHVQRAHLITYDVPINLELIP